MVGEYRPRSITVLTFPKQHILDSSKVKQFTGDNFKFDENRKSSLKGQKTLWEKEKLLVMSNFFFSQCFQKTWTADT